MPLLSEGREVFSIPQRRLLKGLFHAYFGGYTHDEIARQLGVPLGTVKGRLRIGLQKMRGYLDKQGVEAPG